MTRDELEEQIRSVLSEKLSQEQITSILESIKLDDERKLKLVVTSDPMIFGDTAKSTDFFSSPGETKYSGAEFTEITSTVSAIFGDIQPGYRRDINGDLEESKDEAPEFSMDQIQVFAEQLDLEGTYSEYLDEEEYYRHDYVIHIYIPDEKSLSSRKPRSEAEARKIELLRDLKAGKKVQRRAGDRLETVDNRSKPGKRTRITPVYEDVKLTEELEEELNGYVQKVEERTPLASYKELLMADAKLTLMEKLAIQTREKISEENLAIIADRIVSAKGQEFERRISEIEIKVTSNPDVFAEEVVEREEEEGYYGSRSGYHKDNASQSYITPVYGDIKPGDYHYSNIGYSDSSNEKTEEKNLSDFSMNGLQVAIVDTITENASYGYYNSSTAIQIYLPEEKEYEIVSYKEMKEKPKSLDELVMKKMREAIGRTIGETGEIESELTKDELNR